MDVVQIVDFQGIFSGDTYHAMAYDSCNLWENDHECEFVLRLNAQQMRHAKHEESFMITVVGGNSAIGKIWVEGSSSSAVQDARPGSVLLSKGLIRELKVEESVQNGTAKVSISSIPAARRIIVGSKMPGQTKVEIETNETDPHHESVLDGLRKLAIRIRKHDILKTNQVLKKHVIRDLHSQKGPVAIARIDSHSQFLFEFGNDLFVDVDGKYQSKSLFLQMPITAKPVDIQLIMGDCLVGVICVEARKPQDLMLVNLPEEKRRWLEVTTSTHTEIRTGDLFYTINGDVIPDDAWALDRWMENDLFGSVKTVIATVYRPDALASQEHIKSKLCVDEKLEEVVSPATLQKTLEKVEILKAHDSNEVDVTFMDSVSPYYEDDWPSDADVDDEEDWPESDAEKEPGSSYQPGEIRNKQDPGRNDLNTILAEKGFRTIETSRVGNSFWESTAVLLNKNSSIETLRKMGKVAGIREATFMKLRMRLEAGELSEFGITSEQVDNISNANFWNSEVHIAELSRNLRLQICVWILEEEELQLSFTTEPYQAPEGEIQANAPEAALNVLLCNALDPFSEHNRNHFQPLINSDNLAEGLGFSIVWGNFEDEGVANDNVSDVESWENISICSDVQSVCSLADFDDAMVQNKDVKIGLVVYRSKVGEVMILRREEVSAKDGEIMNLFNLPHGDFNGDSPLSCAESIFEEMAWWEDPKSFAILERIIIVQEQGSLVLLFPARCECDLILINDSAQDLQWRNVAAIVGGRDTELPASMRAVVSKGARLLEQFKEEMPPLLDRLTRESADLIMTVLRTHKKRLNKNGIEDAELIEYFACHPDDMAWMLENLTDPNLNCKALFTRIQLWLRDKLGRTVDIRQLPQQYHLDVSNDFSNDIYASETEQMRLDRLLAQSLHDEEFARDLEKQQKRASFENKQQEKAPLPPPRKPAPPRGRNPYRKQIKLTCTQTFMTRGHPNEKISKGWVVDVVQESFENGAHLILIDHRYLKCKQWLGVPDLRHFGSGVEELQYYVHEVKPKKKQSKPPSIDDVKQPKPSAPSIDDVKQPEPSAPSIAPFTVSLKSTPGKKSEEKQTIEAETNASTKDVPKSIIPESKNSRMEEKKSIIPESKINKGEDKAKLPVKHEILSVNKIGDAEESKEEEEPSQHEDADWEVV